MKKIILFAIMLLSVSTFAQRNQNNSRTQNNDRSQQRYVYTATSYYDTSRFARDIRNLKLSRYQEKEFYRLIDKMYDDIRLVRARNGRNTAYRVQQIEKNFNHDLAQLLTRSQYNKWNKYYAGNYLYNTNRRIYS